MELLVCMSISGSIPVVICLLLYVIQRENYNYILGRRLLLTGVFFYLVPVQLIKYLIPPNAFPESKLLTNESQLYLSGSLSFLYLSGVKDRVSIYGCRSGLISYQNCGWQELFSFPFMKLSDTGKGFIHFGILYSKK